MKYTRYIIILLACVLTSKAVGDEATRLKAVSYALTGYDDKLETVDEKNCIYMKRTPTSRETFYMNKIQLSRLKMSREIKQTSTKLHYQITVHGKEPFYVLWARNKEEILNDDNSTRDAFKVLGATETEIDGYMTQIKKNTKEHGLGEEKDTLKTELELDLMLDDYERYQRAWAYIYNNGCTSAKDDF